MESPAGWDVIFGREVASAVKTRQKSGDVARTSAAADHPETSATRRTAGDIGNLSASMTAPTPLCSQMSLIVLPKPSLVSCAAAANPVFPYQVPSSRGGAGRRQAARSDSTKSRSKDVTRPCSSANCAARQRPGCPVTQINCPTRAAERRKI